LWKKKAGGTYCSAEGKGQKQPGEKKRGRCSVKKNVRGKRHLAQQGSGEGTEKGGI